MERKQESGQILLIVSVFIAISTIIILGLFQQSKMHYDVAKAVKQSANHYMLGESTITQCCEGMNNLIKREARKVLNNIDAMIVINQGLEEIVLEKDAIQIDGAIGDAYLLKMLLNQINCYYFEPLGSKNNTTNFFKPIDMGFRIRLGGGEEGIITKVYPRIYTGECKSTILMNDQTREGECLKEAVKSLPTQEEIKDYCVLVKKNLEGGLEGAEGYQFNSLSKKIWENNHIIIQVVIEDINKKGRVLNKEAILAGVTLKFAKNIKYSLKHNGEMSGKPYLEADNLKVRGKIEWIQSVK